MKSLDKDRNRRYDTANAFADDVQRFLNDEAIQARPPSTFYRLRKFARRNKALVSTVATTFAALALGLAIALWGLGQAREQAKRADENAEELARKVDELEQTKQRLEEESKQRLAALLRLRDAALREAIFAVLSGDKERADEALRAAEEVGIESADLALFKAIVALNETNYPDAIKFADEARHGKSSVQDHDRAGAFAIRVAAEMWSGQFGPAEVHAEKLQRMEPDSHIDRLLQAYGMVSQNPQLAVSILDSDERLSRSPLGVFIRGVARCLAAVDAHDHDTLREAIRDLEVTCYQLHDSPAALGFLLLAYGVGVEFYCGTDLEKYCELRGRKIAQSPAFGDYFCWGRWHLYNRIGDEKGADAACRDVRSDQPCWFVANHCLGRYPGVEALVRFDAFMEGKADTPYLRLARAHLLCHEPDAREKMKASLEDLLQDDASIIRRHALCALCLVFNELEIEQIAGTMPKSDDLLGFDSVWKGEACFLFLAGQMEEDQLIEHAGDHRYTQANVYYTIGMKRLAAGKHGKAKDMFEKCVATMSIGTIDYGLARAYFKRMTDDPSWPPPKVNEP